ncbi:hypothetical protein GCM10022419_133190 [Nonomuraea rosea]|uniref:Transposase IS111A/IS1328/IS1533 N-terminal domain-containing protein n=1 Tax=Nonomuraea rosea TaxID=638574 RepID=A0ABP7A4V2_9ACTN
MQSFGIVTVVGIEGTGAYGAGLARYLHRQEMNLTEVDRPDRKTRRFEGKSDPIDAIQAAKAALACERTGTPKQRDIFDGYRPGTSPTTTSTGRTNPVTTPTLTIRPISLLEYSDEQPSAAWSMSIIEPPDNTQNHRPAPWSGFWHRPASGRRSL